MAQKMKKSEREKIINKIVDDFNEHQIHDSYWFKHSETQIEWSSHQEIYLILHRDKTWDYARPKDLDWHVMDLKDQDLREYKGGVNGE